jgi:hypothetical protein
VQEGASLPPQDSRHTPLSFGLRVVGQAEIPDDRAVVAEDNLALGRPDSEASAAADVGKLFARQLRRLPVQLELVSHGSKIGLPRSDLAMVRSRYRRR